jgi:hypothetical protein
MSVPACPYDEGVSVAAGIVRQHHRRLLPAYVAALVLGIFGMHALMQRCPTPQHAMTTATATTQTLAHHADEHLAVTPALANGAGALQLAEPPSSGFGDMLMLCAAMLLGAGAVLALLLRRRLARPFGLPRPWLIGWRPALPIAATGPPRTLAFAVVRC